MTTSHSSTLSPKGTDNFWDAFSPVSRYYEIFCTLNGVDDSNLDDKIAYSGATANNGGTNDPEGTIADWMTNNARFRTFKWLNDYGIPVVEYTFSLAQAHNCLPGYRPEIWNLVKHYSVETAEDGTITHYYSESAFAEDDKIAISFE